MATILVVDDDTLTLKLACGILEREGHTVITKNTWRAVNSVIFRGSVDLMVLDVNLPGLTGDQVAEIVKKTRPGKDLPILLISDLPEKELEARADSCGASGWLRKPLNRQRLVAAIDPILETAGTDRTS